MTCRYGFNEGACELGFPGCVCADEGVAEMLAGSRFGAKVSATAKKLRDRRLGTAPAVPTEER